MLKIKLRNKIVRLFILFLLTEFFCFFSGCAHINLRDTNTETSLLQNPIKPSAYSIEDKPCTGLLYEDYITEKNIYVSNNAYEWIEKYNKRFGDEQANKVFMSDDEIKALNKKIQDECFSVFDMSYVPEKIPKNELCDMIEKYSLPYGELRRKNGEQITSDTKNNILKNRNLDNISENIVPKFAIITSRCNLTSFPTDIGFYDYGDIFYNKIQETELVFGLPVIVLHESYDSRYIFVQSYFYRGWIPIDSAAYCDENDYKKFLSPQNFVTVIKAKVKTSDIMLDMGVKLPYTFENNESFFVEFPKRDNNGKLATAVVGISKNDAVFGNLTLTMKNYYNQCFEYLGTEYGWGGSDGGIDCSGFVCAVFRTFGIYLPRNTNDQFNLPSKSLSLSSSGLSDITNKLTELNSPAAIYRPGHVMLYLGIKDGVNYIIHAPRGGEKVKSEPLWDIENIMSITEFK